MRSYHGDRLPGLLRMPLRRSTSKTFEAVWPVSRAIWIVDRPSEV
jgi:hypothetical protein